MMRHYRPDVGCLHTQHHCTYTHRRAYVYCVAHSSACCHQRSPRNTIRFTAPAAHTRSPFACRRAAYCRTRHATLPRGLYHPHRCLPHYLPTCLHSVGYGSSVDDMICCCFIFCSSHFFYRVQLANHHDSSPTTYTPPTLLRMPPLPHCSTTYLPPYVDKFFCAADRRDALHVWRGDAWLRHTATYLRWVGTAP